MPRSINDIDWDTIRLGPFRASPQSWAEQVLYFFLVDRFSDGREDGVLDTAGRPVTGTTPRYGPLDNGTAVTTEADAARWRNAGRNWVGGTLAGAASKLGYLRRLGVTALWVSPVLRQRVASPDYHGYGVVDFLEVDQHFGTENDLVELVAAAHDQGMSVVLDVVVNHTGDVFGYVEDRPDVPDPGGGYAGPPWRGEGLAVTGWRDETGAPVLPFPQPVGDRPNAAVWPVQLQADGVFTCRGRIVDWDGDPEFRQGDFATFKDVWHGSGSLTDYQPSEALRTLVRAYQYWVARADLDGMRIDTVKHMDPGATRYLASALHEFARGLGKERFFLVGEITGPRSFAIATMESTGLDAALGLADQQTHLENLVKGWQDPAAYFELFRHAGQVGHGSHTWFADRVVTAIDDHDQVRFGAHKERFAADDLGARLAFAALATNVTTLGVPCLYYGSEQGLDGQGGHDRYLREAMFGGAFGAFRSTGRHVFDEEHPVYRRLSALLALRRQLPAMRSGRQYLRPISGDGVSFGLPRRLGGPSGGRMTSVVAWSRILGDEEVVCAINTDVEQDRTVWVTVDAGLQAGVDTFEYRYPGPADAPGRPAPVESRNGRSVLVSVPAAGCVVLQPSAASLAS